MWHIGLHDYTSSGKKIRLLDLWWEVQSSTNTETAETLRSLVKVQSSTNTEPATHARFMYILMATTYNPTNLYCIGWKDLCDTKASMIIHLVAKMRLLDLWWKVQSSSNTETATHARFMYILMAATYNPTIIYIYLYRLEGFMWQISFNGYTSSRKKETHRSLVRGAEQHQHRNSYTALVCFMNVCISMYEHRQHIMLIAHMYMYPMNKKDVW